VASVAKALVKPTKKSTKSNEQAFPLDEPAAKAGDFSDFNIAA
jgi:hypothetical protein